MLASRFHEEDDEDEGKTEYDRFGVHGSRNIETVKR